MEIKRDLYLNQLISRKHNGLIKVVTGLRRCGKSYLIFNLFKNHLIAEGVEPHRIFECAFDTFENKQFQDPNVLYPYLKERISDTGRYYLLLDEVQLLQEFESVLNSLLRMGNVDIYVTGSNAHFLSKDVITEFRGRGDNVHLYPLNFAEFMSAYSGTKQDGWNEYMLYGGLPPVVNFSTPDQKISFLKSLFEETYLITQYDVNENGNGLRKQLEIDFVCNKGSKRYYIQSAYVLPDQAKMEQEQRPLIRTGDSFKKIIIAKDSPAPYYNDAGILIMNIYDFLLNEQSLEY